MTDHCSPKYPGIMFMNYMDYTDDDVMNFFTQGQQDRALSLFYIGGARSGLCGQLLKENTPLPSNTYTGCGVVLRNCTIQNNANVIITDGGKQTIIDGTFSVPLGSTLEIR